MSRRRIVFPFLLFGLQAFILHRTAVAQDAGADDAAVEADAEAADGGDAGEASEDAGLDVDAAKAQDDAGRQHDAEARDASAVSLDASVTSVPGASVDAGLDASGTFADAAVDAGGTLADAAAKDAGAVPRPLSADLDLPKQECSLNRGSPASVVLSLLLLALAICLGRRRRA